MEDNQYTGWTPVLGAEEYKGGFVMKVTDWLGDGCNKPPQTLYVADEGYTTEKRSAKILPLYKEGLEIAPARAEDIFNQ